MSFPKPLNLHVLARRQTLQDPAYPHHSHYGYWLAEHGFLWVGAKEIIPNSNVVVVGSDYTTGIPFRNILPQKTGSTSETVRVCTKPGLNNSSSRELFSARYDPLRTHKQQDSRDLPAGEIDSLNIFTLIGLPSSIIIC